ADGSVIVGTGNSGIGSEAFRWTSGGGMAGFGLLSNSGGSNATAVSADGSVVVGTGSIGSGNEMAFRWTAAGGMIGLGYLPSVCRDDGSRRPEVDVGDGHDVNWRFGWRSCPSRRTRYIAGWLRHRR
ncbi:MAG TPA: hypothetical protein PJ982_19905, partial [Lacipirellulaceae bacterium]|nr:hypothetical protein [Lacipirellulaceae bacterium]